MSDRMKPGTPVYHTGSPACVGILIRVLGSAGKADVRWMEKHEDWSKRVPLDMIREIEGVRAQLAREEWDRRRAHRGRRLRKWEAWQEQGR